MINIFISSSILICSKKGKIFIYLRDTNLIFCKIKKNKMDLLDKKSYVIMGILNVTPDSFSDGGKYFKTEDAVNHALRLEEEGADIIDIGGESTRPKAESVSVEEECSRVLPVIEKIAKKIKIPISIDTTKSDVAKRALDAGAYMINDISAGRFDSNMPQIAAEKKCPIILMHSRKTPKTMQENPYYKDVILEVKNELLERITVFENFGVLKKNIIIDPGIGFAKRLEDNLTILKRLSEFKDMGFPICIGVSRKSFIGMITNKNVNERLSGTIAATVFARLGGAKIFRVHDVWQTIDAIKIVDAINNS
jgi:dihydropteroate synthase